MRCVETIDEGREVRGEGGAGGVVGAREQTQIVEGVVHPLNELHTISQQKSILMDKKRSDGTLEATINLPSHVKQKKMFHCWDSKFHPS